MTTVYQEKWFATSVGRATDPDGVAGFQCVDVPKDYAERIWADTSWRQAWPGAGNAKDMLDTASGEYFDVILNDPNAADQIPQRGDVIVWGGTGEGGPNPYGHIATVESADADGVDVIQQDGFLQVPMHRARLGYWNPGTGTVLGWLRPKFDDVVLPTDATIKPIPAPAVNYAGPWKAIDLSSHKVGIDLYRTGADMLVTKATEGVGWEDKGKDEAGLWDWRDVIAAARAQGLREMLFHWARPDLGNTAESEAAWFVSTVAPHITEATVLALDWEPIKGEYGRRGYTAAWAAAWMAEVRRLLPKNPLWFYSYTNILNTPDADWVRINTVYPLWHAEYWTNVTQGYGPSPQQVRTQVPWPAGVAMWQYTSHGRVPGYPGDVDLNALYAAPTDKSTKEDFMASIHDLMVYPAYDNGPQYSQVIKDLDERTRLIVSLLQPGEEGKVTAGPVFQAIADLKSAVAAAKTDPATIAQLVIDGVGTQKAEDVLLELGKLITAAATKDA